MNINELKAKLKEITRISDEEWMASLSVRKEKELKFHDRDRDRPGAAALSQDDFEKYYSNKKFYSTVGKSSAYRAAWIAEQARGRVFLDYACGNGGNAIVAAKAGALLSIGLDISRVSIDNAKRDADKEKLDNTFFLQADAENTRLPDGCVDAVICSGMLHHLDLSYAFPELRRILAPAGKILAIEALNYNPIIALYRRLTPDMRTEWEKTHILSLKDVEFARRFFNIGEIKYWHVTSYAGAYFPKLLPLFDAIDSLLVTVPLIQRMAWIFTFELMAKEDITIP